MEIVALTIMTVSSIVGFAAIFFTTFGTLIIFIGILLYAVLTEFSLLTFNSLMLVLILYLIGEAVEYIFVIIGARKFGASKKAAMGALLGAILGAVLGVSLLGIGIIPGTFLGIFLGAFLVELIARRNLKQSLKAGAGGVIGRIVSIMAKVLVAFSMFIIVISKIINQ